MLISVSATKCPAAAPEKEAAPLRTLDIPSQSRYDADTIGLLKRPAGLGDIRSGEAKHFYSDGAFNLIQLVLYVLDQTGPADIFLSTYSISTESLSALKKMQTQGRIRSARFLIDNRVRSISPKPYDMLCTSFPGCYRNCALHAKVALIHNQEWKISIVGSQNATRNPKLERGIIHTDPKIWEFDHKILNYEFDRGTT